MGRSRVPDPPANTSAFTDGNGHRRIGSTRGDRVPVGTRSCRSPVRRGVESGVAQTVSVHESDVIAGVFLVSTDGPARRRAGVFVETYRREWVPSGRRDDPGQPGRPRRPAASSGCTTTSTRPTTGTCRSAGRASCCTTSGSASPTDGATAVVRSRRPGRRRRTTTGPSHPARRRARLRVADRRDDHVPRRRLLQPGRRARRRVGRPRRSRRLGRHDPMLSARDRANPKRAEITDAPRYVWPMRDMRLLVTGGAGFIGSNFVRWWARRAARRRDRRASTRSPTRATARASPTSGPHEFVHGDIGDVDRREDCCATTRSTSIVNFAAESHNSSRSSNPSVFFRTNVLGTQRLVRSGAPGRRRAASTTSRRARSTATSPSTAREPFTESSPYRPRTPYNASKAGGDHAVRAYYRDVRPAHHDHELREQLRAVPVPGEGDPAVRDQRDRRPAAPALRVDARTAASGSTSVDHCRAIDAILDDGRVGETYHVGTGEERAIEEIADAVLAALGKPAIAQDDRPRPARSRPALRPRLVEDPRRARLGADGRLRRRASPRPSSGTRRNRDWWEPLRERAPVQERRPGRRREA